MDQSSEKQKDVDVTRMLREVRDAGMESWARIALGITGTDSYQRAMAALGMPRLVAMAVLRKTTDEAMSFLLANLNLPSRADVLALSTRLTHIETTLDDLSAAVDELRRSGAQAPARRGGTGTRAEPRGSGNNRAARSAETREG